MKGILKALASLMLLIAVAAPSAQAEFGIEDFDLAFTAKDGSSVSQAGAHPFALTNVLSVKSDPFTELPDGSIKDLVVELPVGFVGAPGVTPLCSGAEYIGGGTEGATCADSTAVGVAEVVVNNSPQRVPVYNLVPAPGTAAKLGFRVLGSAVTLDIGVSETPPYRIVTRVTKISQIVHFFSSELTLWGNPADPAHDAERGSCLGTGKSCPTAIPNRPFLTLPRACSGPLTTDYQATSWEAPGPYLPSGEPNLSDPRWDSGAALTHNDGVPPVPLGMTGCEKLGFDPTISAQPTSKAAGSPTGLDFSLDVKDEGLTSPTGLAKSDIRKAVVTLPEGFTSNPSIADGLGSCSQADLARETAFSAPGAGCPESAKLGTVEVQTPLLDENLYGSLYIAKPYENEFGSLLALYFVIKNSHLGISIKQAARVELDPATGRLKTIVDDIPQLPFSHFKLRFREGARSPLVTPPGCERYEATAELTPWSGEAPITTTSAFEIVTGPQGGPCPPAGLRPFHPALTAGTLNNAAGQFSPFILRLSRTDSEQEITGFSIKLPSGVIAKLAGIPFCSEAAISAAQARSRPLGGREELASPSCPKASEIGRTLVGVGVGGSLSYAPGKVYLAGPYNGSALSVVAVTAGVVGPFDLGTVVVREALRIDSQTAEVFVDAGGSDPIPHIISGVPVHLRDLRVYVDRPGFVLNPTSCNSTSIASIVLGSGLNFGSRADDQPFTATTPFQASDCASLPFKPKLGLRLIGGTGRGAHPKLKATLKMKGIGEAAVSRAQVTLPKSLFLDNTHIRTICTRVQFAAGAIPGERCPAGALYGYARAITPLLDEPVEGPVFLRSSNHRLPDLVAALHNGQININLVGRIDSVRGGGIRNTFEVVPDAPVTSFALEMQGGKKGLLVNSADLCERTQRARTRFTGQNGKLFTARPPVRAACKGSAKGRRR